MLTTNDDQVAYQVRSQRAFGYDKRLGERQIAGVYDIESLGWNYRMSEGHAAVLARLQPGGDGHGADNADGSRGPSQGHGTGLRRARRAAGAESEA